MIHAAITAVALSCCTTNPIAEDRNVQESRTWVDFDGGSVADFVDVVVEEFGDEDGGPNIVLLPGTDGVELPAMKLRISNPEDAFLAIANHVYSLPNRRMVSLDFEVVGNESSILRLHGQSIGPRTPTARGSSRSNVVGSGTDALGVSIITVPASDIDSAMTLAKTVLELAGLIDVSRIVPIPDDGILLVSSTNEGRGLVEDIVFKARKSATPRSMKTTGDVVPAEVVPTGVGKESDPRTRLARVARIRSDPSIDQAARAEAKVRYHELMDEIRRDQRRHQAD